MNNNTASYILRLLETPGLGVVKTNSIIESVEHNLEPNRLQSILNKKQFESFLLNEEKVLSNWEQIKKNGVNCITILDEDYPERLKSRLQKKLLLF
ncbi:MAG: hypothetical protein ABIF87_03755 [Pseudomonadota bacterium]